MHSKITSSIAAVVAAAGYSRRMGDFKQLLPWGAGTVIGAVVANLQAAGADPLICVVGHRGDEVAAALSESPACIIRNPDYDRAEMLRSYQVGVRALVEGQKQHPKDARKGKGVTEQSAPLQGGEVQDDGSRVPPVGTLLALGDQPHIPPDVIRRILEEADKMPDQIVIPSHDRRRGHPIYLPRRFWSDLLALGVDETLRDLLNRAGDAIVYVDVDTDAIRRDMDDWTAYQKLQQEYAAVQDVKREA